MTTSSVHTPQDMVCFWVPSPIHYTKYTIHKVTEYQPGAARRKLKDETIAYMLEYVPADIKGRIIPKIMHWELKSENDVKSQFDIVNFTENDLAFDETLLLKMNGQKLYQDGSEYIVCSFTPADCQLIVYNENNDIVILNKDVPAQGKLIGSTEWHRMTIHRELSGIYSYESRRIIPLK